MHCHRITLKEAIVVAVNAGEIQTDTHPLLVADYTFCANGGKGVFQILDVFPQSGLCLLVSRLVWPQATDQGVVGA
jgi:hypothetical protein